MKCEMKFIEPLKPEQQCANDARFACINQELKTITNLCVVCYNNHIIKEDNENLRAENKRIEKGFFMGLIIIGIICFIFITLSQILIKCP